MPAMTLRNIPADVHRALKARAARHGRSAEAELRMILAEAVGATGAPPAMMGSRIQEVFRGLEMTDEELKGFERDRSPHEPVSFE